MSMKAGEIEAVLRMWLDGWNRRDSAALAGCYSQDSIFVTMLAGKLQGRAAIESLYRGWFSAFPEMVFKVDTRIRDGDRVALFWSQHGKHVGDFCGFTGTGRSFVLQGVFLMTFQNGMIIDTKSIYDFTGLLLQIGVLKAKPAV